MSNIQNLANFQLPKNFRWKSGIYVQLWWLIQESLFRLSPQFMFGWRRFLLRLFGAKIGLGTLIRPTARVTYPWKVCIGENVWIGDDVVLYSLGEIEIGDNTVISQRAYICTGLHDFRKPTFDISSKKITIEREVWIATDVFIAPGITIGQGAVIGARSSVFHDMPALMVCYGNPARPIKPRLPHTG